MLWAVVLLLALATLIGGGTHPGFLGDVIIQFAAIPILLTVLLRFHNKANRPEIRVFDRVLVAFFGVLAALIIVQLIPLPNLSFFETQITSLAKRGKTLVDVAPGWAPLNATPTQTWAVALALLPPLAVFFGVTQLGPKDRSRLVSVILIIGTAGLILGFMQVLQGPKSPLRFFEFTNPFDAVGTFANRNHFASQLAVVLAFAAAWVAWTARSLLQGGTRRSESHRGFELLIAILLFMAMFLGLALTRSRAGLGLAVLAVLGALIPAFIVSIRRDPQQARQQSVFRTVLVPVLAGAFILAFLLGMQRISTRFGTDPTQDLRWTLTSATLEQIMPNLPFGTGLGSFVPIYAATEKITDIRTSAFVNRAHNDALEFVLETGIFGIVLMVLFVTWFAWRSYNAWSRPLESFSVAAARAASLGIVALLLHSLVDYPLRTTALATHLACLLGLLILPRDPRAWQQDKPERMERLKRRRKPTQNESDPMPALNESWPEHSKSRKAQSDTTPLAGASWPEEWKTPKK